MSFISKLREIFSEPINLIDENGNELSKADLSRNQIAITKDYLLSLSLNREDIKKSYDQSIKELNELAKSHKSVNNLLESQERRLENILLTDLYDNTQNQNKGLEELKKAIEDHIDLIKGKKANIGEIRTWSDGKKYQKVQNGWKEVSNEQGDKGEQKGSEGEEITPEESQSIMNYTGSAYRAINNALRKGVTDEKLLAQEKLINSGLDKIQPFKGKVYRAESATDDLEVIFDHYNKSDSIEFPAFTSTTATKGVTKDFGGEILFEIESKNGKSIKDYSGMPHEDEVLFKSKSNFKVKSVKLKKLKSGIPIGLEIKLIEV
jgi:hypothetical protein